MPPAPISPVGMPPVAPLPPAALNMQSKLSEADGATTSLEHKIADLEKKLMEEREKVLLASLRSKEEEAVSAKVETSIKDIQDKLRRERKEQEMEEARHKAEARLVQMERRLSEEREAWVQTLKSQLNQRDTVSQEMEGHFATRLKDLEYRWAQEKAGLEAGVREREAEISRLKQETALKAEQEKAFWEDRVKTISTDRDRLERELERVKDKTRQDLDLSHAESQRLQAELAKMESALKFFGEQTHMEKNSFEKQVNSLKSDLESKSRNLEGEEKANSELRGQIHSIQMQQETLQNQLVEKQKAVEISRNEAAEGAREVQRLHGEIERLQILGRDNDRALEELKEQIRAKGNQLDSKEASLREAVSKEKLYVAELESLKENISKSKAEVNSEVRRVQEEAETRIRSLQTRLNWYDMNAEREYQVAREKARSEIGALQAQLEEVKSREKEAREELLKAQPAEQMSKKLQAELERLQGDWRQAQREMEAHAVQLQDQIKAEERKFQSAEEARTLLEQDLKARSLNYEAMRARLEERDGELAELKNGYEMERERNAEMRDQLEGFRDLAGGKGLEGRLQIQKQLEEKSAELERIREQFKNLKGMNLEIERKEEMFKEKERVFKQLINDKEESLTELKARIHVLERKFNESASELETLKEESKQKMEKLNLHKQGELEERLAALHRELTGKHAQELEKIKAEAANRAREEVPQVDVQAVEAQVRQRLEMESLERMREHESQFDEKLKSVKDEAKKEIDSVRWESESVKEELKRAREARAQIEREAQELLRQAEEHYKRELDRRITEISGEAGQKKGVFTAIGRFLDYPLVDLKKKKEDDQPL